jgi:hypothetical protein
VDPLGTETVMTAITPSPMLLPGPDDTRTPGSAAVDAVDRDMPPRAQLRRTADQRRARRSQVAVIVPAG